MPRKKEKLIVNCRRCRHATLVQFGADPVIAYCPFSDYGEVAAKPRACAHADIAPADLPVSPLPKTRENIFLKYKQGRLSVSDM